MKGNYTVSDGKVYKNGVLVENAGIFMGNTLTKKELKEFLEIVNKYHNANKQR